MEWIELIVHTTTEGSDAVSDLMMELGSGGTTDPLNQRSTMGWKANKAVTILDNSAMVRYEHATSTNLHVDDLATA